MPRPWFKFYPADYLLDAKVDALPLEAQGILVRLWCLCARDGSIPDDRKVVARRAGIPPKTLGKYWDHLRIYFRISDGLLVSDRMIREQAEFQELSEKRKVIGSIGGKKSQAIAQAKRQAKVELSESESDTELKMEEPIGSSCGEPDKPSPPPASPVLMDIPCRGTGPKTWPLTQAKVDEWAAAFPGIDAKAELRKAVQWLKDNPTNGKTHRGMSAFFGRWLSKAQDRAIPNPGYQKSHSPSYRARVDAEYSEMNTSKPTPTQEKPHAREGTQGLLKLLS